GAPAFLETRLVRKSRSGAPAGTFSETETVSRSAADRDAQAKNRIPRTHFIKRYPGRSYHRRNRPVGIIGSGRSSMAEELKRRDFLKAAALAAGPAVISARGANDKINLGWIGVGTRGNAGIEWLHTASPNDVNFVAVC